MALLDTSNIQEIQGAITEYDLDTPRIMTGDRVRLKPDYTDIHKRMMAQYYPTISNVDRDTPDFQISNSHIIRNKFKYSKETPWWSQVFNDVGKEWYFFDECFIENNRPMYAPRKFIRESFSDFIKLNK